MKHFSFYSKRSKKLKGGPAGWDCPCCNPFGCHPRNMKKDARRIVRRKMKQDIQKKVKNDDV